MKVALCFIISYKQIINKENIWREWIETNKDIINVYFHYKNFSQIQSPWIKNHCIKNIVNTSYYNIVPAYIATMDFAIKHDIENKWFCFLTESCVPIISPAKFRELFFENYNYSILKCNKAKWNVDFHRRSNLRFLSKDFHLENVPWFTLKREDVYRVISYSILNKKIYNMICNGGLANESIFAIILQSFYQLSQIKNENTHATDWSRMSSTTSPHLFKYGSKRDIDFIREFKKNNKYTMFLRKVDPLFPDDIILEFIK